VIFSDAYKICVVLLLVLVAPQNVFATDVYDKSQQLGYPEPLRCGIADGKLCALYDVSLVELIVNPVVFHGKRVRVQGFLNLEFEGKAIYLHKEDNDYSITNNGLWVNVSGEGVFSSCKSGSYVLLEGTFDAIEKGHMGAWSGSLDKVTRCMEIDR
jgi:hypothetical protein